MGLNPPGEYDGRVYFFLAVQGFVSFPFSPECGPKQVRLAWSTSRAGDGEAST